MIIIILPLVLVNITLKLDEFEIDFIEMGFAPEPEILIHKSIKVKK